MTEVFMTAIKLGMEGAPEICVERVRSLRWDLQPTSKRLNAYLELHNKLFAPSSMIVRNILMEAINHARQKEGGVAQLSGSRSRLLPR